MQVSLQSAPRVPAEPICEDFPMRRHERRRGFDASALRSSQLTLDQSYRWNHERKMSKVFWGCHSTNGKDSPLTLSCCWNHLGSADQRAGWLARFQLWVRDTNPAALNHGLPRRELNFTLFRLQSLFFRGSNGHHLQRFITILAQWPTAIPQQLTAILLWCVGLFDLVCLIQNQCMVRPVLRLPPRTPDGIWAPLFGEWGFHSWQCPAFPTRPMTSRPGSTAGAKPNSRSDPPLSKQGMDEPRLQSLCAPPSGNNFVVGDGERTMPPRTGCRCDGSRLDPADGSDDRPCCCL